MKRIAWLTLLLCVVLAVSPGCYTFHHRVGDGGTGAHRDTASAWFILWGLVPLSRPNSQNMADNAENYTVTTEFTFVDVVISFFTGIVTIHKQTVTVET